MPQPPPEFLMNPNDVVYLGGLVNGESTPPELLAGNKSLDLDDLDRRLRDLTPPVPPGEADRLQAKARADYEELVALGGRPSRVFQEFGPEDLEDYQKEYEPDDGLYCRRLPEANYWASRLFRWKQFLKTRQKAFKRAAKKSSGGVSSSAVLPDPTEEDPYVLLEKYCAFLRRNIEMMPEFSKDLNTGLEEDIKITEGQMEEILEERKRAGAKADGAPSRNDGTNDGTTLKRKRGAESHAADGQVTRKRVKSSPNSSSTARPTRSSARSVRQGEMEPEHKPATKAEQSQDGTTRRSSRRKSALPLEEKTNTRPGTKQKTKASPEEEATAGNSDKLPEGKEGERRYSRRKSVLPKEPTTRPETKKRKTKTVPTQGKTTTNSETLESGRKGKPKQGKAAPARTRAEAPHGCRRSARIAAKAASQSAK